MIIQPEPVVQWFLMILLLGSIPNGAGTYNGVVVMYLSGSAITQVVSVVSSRGCGLESPEHLSGGYQQGWRPVGRVVQWFLMILGSIPNGAGTMV